MATHSKCAQLDPEASQFRSQLSTERKKAVRQQEAADDTAQDDVRYLRTQPKIQQPNDTSRVKPFPSQTSQFIDLTLSDEVGEVFLANSSRSKAPGDQRKEQNHSKYNLRSKSLGNSQRRFLHRSWDKQRVQENVLNRSEGENWWTRLQEPSVSAGLLARRQQQSERDRKKKKGTRKERKKAGWVNHNLSSDTAVMFTIPEAMTALARPQLVKTIAYNLSTGECLSYPVKRSYHLGAMGRYGNTRVAMHTSLPYRPSGTARFNNLRSDYNKSNNHSS